MEIERGQIVKSFAGRDKGRFFIVLRVEAPYVWLADGRLRKVESPKRKKQMHVRPTVTRIDLPDPVTNKGVWLLLEPFRM